METNIIEQVSQTSVNSKIWWKTYNRFLCKYFLETHLTHIVNFIIGHINVPEEIQMKSIFFNTRFTIESRVFHFKDRMRKDVFFVKDLVKDDGVFIFLLFILKNFRKVAC